MFTTPLFLTFLSSFFLFRTHNVFLYRKIEMCFVVFLFYMYIFLYSICSQLLNWSQKFHIKINVCMDFNRRVLECRLFTLIVWWYFICLMTNQTIRRATHNVLSMSTMNRIYIYLMIVYTYRHTLVCPSLFFARKQVG